MQSTYLDFDLEIGIGQGREYPVVVRSPAGEARANMHLPFDELQLESRLDKLQMALLRSGGTRRRAPSQQEQAVLDFGRALFDTLLAGEVRSLYDVSLSKALQAGQGLRLKLRIASPSLAVLPWEFLYDARQAEFVCLSRDTPIVRYIDLPRPPQPLLLTPPLRILGMLASPSDVARLDVDRERERVEQALTGLLKQGLVELEWLAGQTWRDLQRAMRRGPWHVFHFVGHGEFDANADEGLVLLCDEQGKARRFRATEMGRMLADHRTLRLAVLNACEGAKGSDRDIFSSTASILVQRGMPAVLAMQYEITDRAAVELSRAFYEALAEGLPVDAAVVEARKAVSWDVANTVEWGTPVLYMRAPDGRIFDMSAPAVPLVPPGLGQTQAETRNRPTGQVPLPDLDALYNQALEHFHLERWSEATLIFSEIVALQPNFLDATAKLELARRQEIVAARYTEACTAYDAGRWAAAVESFQMVTELEPTYRDATGRLAEAKRQRELAALYNEAKRLFEVQAWQAVVKVFDLIHKQDAAYADPQGLLPATLERLAAKERERRLAELYENALRNMDAGQLDEARRGLEEVIHLSADYRQAEALLARVNATITQCKAAEAELAELSRVKELFVDRQENLSMFQSMMASTLNSRRILVLRGAKGMGKSFLLRRLQAECQHMGVAHVRIDLADPRGTHDIKIMRDVRDGLGAEAFKPFTDLLNYYTTEGNTLKLQVEVINRERSAGGGVIIQDEATVEGVVAGRDAIVIRDNYLSAPRRDFEIDRRHMQVALTQRFLEGLIVTSKKRKVVCLFDDIDRLDESTAHWLWYDFLEPLVAQDNFMAVLTTSTLPSVDPPRLFDVEDMPLESLSEAHVIEYLERRGVPAADRRGVAALIMSEIGSSGKLSDMAAMVDIYLKVRQKSSS